jgi:hypothetical protein
MKSLSVRWLTLSFLLLSLLEISAYAGSINLGAAGSYGVLAGSTVTNTGSSVISGNLGVWPGSAVTGFPPGIVVGGTIHAGDAAAQAAQSALTNAYNAAAGLAPTMNLTGQNLGGLTLTPGVYFFSSSAQLTGVLTLNTLGNPNAQFVFQIGSTLTTASASSIIFTSSLSSPNVFWQVGSSATLGTGTAFAGNILALTSISLNNGATISCGSALAQNGAVTLINNTISNNCGAVATTPEPGTVSLMGSGLAILAGVLRRRRRT